MLEQYIKERLQEKKILLMTHIVLGYPSFDDSLRIIEAMQEAGVDLIEMQIPFSEPIADGPVILHANQRALDAGATVDMCMDFAEKAKERIDIPLLFMSYYNIITNRGEQNFINEMKSSKIRGAIIPDLPPEEGTSLFASMGKESLDPIFIYSPNTTNERMKYLAEQASGFIYCVARKGVTGSSTAFSHDITEYLARCRASTDLPLAVGFGVKHRRDVEFLEGKAEIAVVGSETIRKVESEGVAAVAPFLRSLRAPS